jgi:phosphoglucosamine mutase
MSATRRLFGTDGIRGVANVAPMMPELAMRLGRAVGASLPAAAGANRPTVVIGRDTRLSGRMLEGAFAAGLSSVGIDVVLAGIVPTPAVACLTRQIGAVGGAVISASHNPFADNGIKLFDHAGFKLDDAAELAIEAGLGDADSDARPTGAALGRIVDLADAGERYVSFLLSTVGRDLRLDGRRVVFDGANGAAFRVGPELLGRLGAEVVATGVAPDGVNINEGCGALHAEGAAAQVRATSAAIGIVVDGDADRILLVDESGAGLDGDELLAILAEHRPERVGSCVVGTVMSNMGLEIALRERGVELARAAVGDRYVLDEMRRRGSRLGGEPSGHLILLDHGTTGDALLAALQVLDLMHETGAPLSALRGAMRRLPQTLVNVRVSERVPLADVAPVAEAIADAEKSLDGRGRVLVRYSGTEPLVRVMVEGEDHESIRTCAERIANVICVELGE